MSPWKVPIPKISQKHKSTYQKHDFAAESIIKAIELRIGIAGIEENRLANTIMVPLGLDVELLGK